MNANAPAIRQQIFELSWHAYRILTLRPQVSMLPKSRAVPLILIALASLALAANGHYSLAVMNPIMLVSIVLAFNLRQLAAALALITIAVHGVAFVMVGLLGLQSASSWAVGVETGYSLITVLLWLRGRAG